jgi:hypothetical protein
MPEDRVRVWGGQGEWGWPLPGGPAPRQQSLGGRGAGVWGIKVARGVTQVTIFYSSGPAFKFKCSPGSLHGCSRRRDPCSCAGMPIRESESPKALKPGFLPVFSHDTVALSVPPPTGPTA